MTEQLQNILGLERMAGGKVESWSIHWSNLETPFHALLFLLAFAALAYGVWHFYKREPDYCPRKKKITLAVLRAAGVAILMVILAGPVLEIVKTGVSKSKVVVLVDTSKSMTRQDKYSDPKDKLVAAKTLGVVDPDEKESLKIPTSADEQINTTNRINLVRAMLKNEKIDLLNKLQQEYDVEMWTFGRAGDMARIGTEEGEGKLLPEALDDYEADGPVTEIGGTLRATVNRLKGQPLTGIVLVTDGGNNKGQEPTLVAGDLPTRVFPIGIGVPEAKDIAISYVFMEPKIFIDDPAPIHVRIKHHGFSGEQCQVVVTTNDGEEMARHPVNLLDDGEQTATVRIKPKKAGKFTLKIEVPAPDGDSEIGNNVKEREIEVIDDKIKVLILESEPRWEFRFLKTALLRDKRLETKILLRVPDLVDLAKPNSPFIKTFPTKEELFQYDVIIFGNLPNDGFWTEQDLEHIREFVINEGGGIWFIAGKNNFPDTYKDSKLEKLIPVEFERMPETNIDDEMHNPITEGFRVLLTPEGKQHSLTRLDTGEGALTDEENAELWDLVPDFFWYHKATRPKLGATVLLVHGGDAELRAGTREGPAPLMVTAQVGRGRVVYNATDEFWRMRYPYELGPSAQERLYGHCVQYLGLAHCLGGSPRIQIETDQNEYAVGDRIKVTAKILNKDTYDPLTAETVAAIARNLDLEAEEEVFNLTPVPGQPGMFRGDLVAEKQGRFRVSLRDEEEGNAYKDYVVREPQIEMDSPDMKKDLLDNIAKASRSSDEARNARMYYPHESDLLVEELKASQRRLEQRIEDPLWDSPLMAILFTVLMGAEWFVRKRSDLM